MCWKEVSDKALLGLQPHSGEYAKSHQPWLSLHGTWLYRMVRIQESVTAVAVAEVAASMYSGLTLYQAFS